METEQVIIILFFFALIGIVGYFVIQQMTFVPMEYNRWGVPIYPKPAPNREPVYCVSGKVILSSSINPLSPIDISVRNLSTYHCGYADAVNPTGVYSGNQPLFSWFGSGANIRVKIGDAVQDLGDFSVNIFSGVPVIGGLFGTPSVTKEFELKYIRAGEHLLEVIIYDDRGEIITSKGFKIKVPQGG